MPTDPDQNSDPNATSLIPDETLNIISPSLPDESAYFEYSSSSSHGQTYPKYSYPSPFYLHYPYPPPSYLYNSGTRSPGGRSYPAYSYPLPLAMAIKQLPKQYLKVLTRPGVATFMQEKQKAAWNIISVQLAFLAIMGGLLGFTNYTFILPMILSQLNLSKIGGFDVANMYKGMALSGGFSGLISTPIAAFISWTIYYYIAKAFKGRGEFIEYIYCFTLYYIPIQIIGSLLIFGSLLVFMPLVGLLLSFVVSLYIPILAIFMTMAVHRLSTGKAILAVLILPICGIALVVVAALAFFILIFLFRVIL